MYFAGIDGCRRGWVVCIIDEAGALVSCEVMGAFADVVAVLETRVTLTLIDMPIGMKEEGSEGRRVEAAIRAVLGRRACCVFNMPLRAVAHAPDRQAARALNARLGGKGLSVQTLAICPKIAEVDILMRQRPSLQASIREAHPEICFAMLNDGAPLPPKKTAEGQDRRLALIEKAAPAARFAATLPGLVARSRGKARQDDIVDAMVCAVTARAACLHGLATFPAEAQEDGYGLRMEVVYAKPRG